MKKIIFILGLLLLFLLPSCKHKNYVDRFNGLDHGDVDYFICGIYICVDDTQDFSMVDDNPKIYFDYAYYYSDMFHTYGGKTSSACNFDYTSKAITDESSYKLYSGKASLNFVNQNVKKVKLYQIRYINEKYAIDKEFFEEVNVSKAIDYEFHNSFTYNDMKYRIQLTLQFKGVE